MSKSNEERILEEFMNIRSEADRSKAMESVAEYIRTRTPEECRLFSEILGRPSNPLAMASALLWCRYVSSELEKEKARRQAREQNNHQR